MSGMISSVARAEIELFDMAADIHRYVVGYQKARMPGADGGRNFSDTVDFFETFSSILKAFDPVASCCNM